MKGFSSAFFVFVMMYSNIRQITIVNTHRKAKIPLKMSVFTAVSTSVFIIFGKAIKRNSANRSKSTATQQKMIFRGMQEEYCVMPQRAKS